MPMTRHNGIFTLESALFIFQNGREKIVWIHFANTILKPGLISIIATKRGRFTGGEHHGKRLCMSVAIIQIHLIWMLTRYINRRPILHTIVPLLSNHTGHQALCYQHQILLISTQMCFKNAHKKGTLGAKHRVSTLTINPYIVLNLTRKVILLNN